MTSPPRHLDFPNIFNNRRFRHAISSIYHTFYPTFSNQLIYNFTVAAKPPNPAKLTRYSTSPPEEFVI